MRHGTTSTPITVACMSSSARMRQLASASCGLLLVMLALLMSRPAGAAPLLVDDFNAPAPQRTSVLTGLGEDSLIDFDASVLGGVRGTYHHNYTNPLGSLSVLSVGGGQLSSTVGVQARSEVLVSYGAFTRPTGAPNIGGPLLGLDASAYDSFRWTFSGVSTTMNLNVVLYTANPLDPGTPLYYSTVGVNAAPTVLGGPMVVDLPMRLTDPFNFAQVDGIVLVINRANDATNVAFNLDRFELVSAVPEPGTGAMLLTGLAAMALLGYRRRRV